jgi:FkbM family methyltransferase
MGFDINLYFVNAGIVANFMLHQYNYEDIVMVKDDDIVIDCGGCWGDTALYFAAMGAKEVYVYEFIPSNIQIMNKNLNLNPQYKDKIILINNPVWSSSHLKLSYLDKGPASVVDDFKIYNDKVETISIDELVKNKNIERVDFIKMDIEGAEIPALNGAIETIRKFKPKLAISAYHKLDDLKEIPKLINSIRGDYKFYFDYYTIISDEAIVYAI